MKLLLTGQPGVGKTTILKRTISHNPHAFWIISEEKKNEFGERIGFKALTSLGDEAVFAHKTEIRSQARVGSFRINLGIIDEIFSSKIREAIGQYPILILDEIGRMQMLSPIFSQVVRRLFDDDGSGLIATITYGDEWTREFINLPDVVVINLTAENRNLAEAAILSFIDGQTNFHKLTVKQQQTAAKMAKQYGINDELIQLKKLFKNAIKYVVEGKVRSELNGTYIVKGDHDDHEVIIDRGVACDCDLFNGRNEFAGRSGECSHLQAVELMRVA